jgi:hypothetical protein
MILELQIITETGKRFLNKNLNENSQIIFCGLAIAIAVNNLFTDNK